MTLNLVGTLIPPFDSTNQYPPKGLSKTVEGFTRGRHQDRVPEATGVLAFHSPGSRSDFGHSEAIHGRYLPTNEGMGTRYVDCGYFYRI